MGQVLRAICVVAMLAAGALPLSAFDGPTQTKGGAPAPADAGATDAKSKAVTQAEKLLERGIKAYEEGQPNQAIRAFTTALNSGGLPSQQMARALYYRGLAYAKREMPGQAISDLTNAAWIKDGLSPAEAQAALQARAAAYRAAGISVPTPTAVAGGADASGWSAATSGSTSPTSSGGVSGFFDSIFGGGSSSSGSSDETAVTTSSIGDNAPAPAAASWAQATEVAAVEQPAPPPAEPPAAAPPPPPPPPQPPVPAANAAPEPIETTVVAVAPEPSEPPPAPAEPAAAPATGRYHIQVASLRSRSEAYALSVRLLSQYGQQFGSRKPQVDEKIIGSMGTFYRVRVGPYTSADESRELCTSLQANGLDCLIVMQ